MPETSRRDADKETRLADSELERLARIRRELDRKYGLTLADQFWLADLLKRFGV